MFSQDVDWIQVELAAKALCEFRHHACAGSRLVHLVHPRPVSWSSIAAVLSEDLSVPLVPYADWLAKLEARAGAHAGQSKAGDAHLRVEDLKEIPALRLLSFYQALKLGNDEEGNALDFPRLDTSCAVAASPTLADPQVHQVTSEIVKEWLKSWRAGGDLDA